MQPLRNFSMKNSLKKAIFGLALSLSIAVSAHANLSNSKLEKAAAEAVIRRSSDAKSEVAREIAARIADTTDGRNPQGSISLPLKRAELRTLILDGEVGTEASDEKTDEYATYRILVSIPTSYNVHRAQEKGTLNFTVTATEATTTNAKGKVISHRISTSEATLFSEK